MKNQAAPYRFRLDCQLGSSGMAVFPELVIEVEDGGQTTLSGIVADQAALHGILMRIRDLGLPLIEVKRIGDLTE